MVGFIRKGTYIQQWISSGVSIPIQSLFFAVDPMCTVAIESFSDPVCTEDSAGTSDSSSGLPVGAIAGGTVAGVTMVVIAGIVGVILWMRCHTPSAHKLR